VLLTFGLLSPNKGIEHVLNALPEILASFEPRLYRAGRDASEPAAGTRRGLSLQPGTACQEKESGEERHFYNRFVEVEELKEFIGAADLYITPI